MGSRGDRSACGLDCLAPRALGSSPLEAQLPPCFLRPVQYTLNGKKVEVAVKQVIAGKAVQHRGAFSNPEALDLYRDIPELQDF